LSLNTQRHRKYSLLTAGAKKKANRQQSLHVKFQCVPKYKRTQKSVNPPIPLSGMRRGAPCSSRNAGRHAFLSCRVPPRRINPAGRQNIAPPATQGGPLHVEG